VAAELRDEVTATILTLPPRARQGRALLRAAAGQEPGLPIPGSRAGAHPPRRELVAQGRNSVSPGCGHGRLAVERSQLFSLWQPELGPWWDVAPWNGWLIFFPGFQLSFLGCSF